MTMVLGIDPGKSGGMACHYGDEIETLKLDNTERDIADWLIERAGRGKCHAFIERVSSSPQMGVVSAFTFGRSYGMLRGLLSGLKIPFEEVAPQKWQKELGCLTGGDKNKSKAKAQQFFPGLRITHAIADCILISEFGRRVLNQRNGTTVNT